MVTQLTVDVTGLPKSAILYKCEPSSSNHGLAYAKNWGNSSKVVETKVVTKGEIKAFASEVFDVDIEDKLSLGHLRLLTQVHNELSKGNNQGLRVQVR